MAQAPLFSALLSESLSENQHAHSDPHLTGPSVLAPSPGKEHMDKQFLPELAPGNPG